MQEALAHARDDVALGTFATTCLFAGPATYLVGNVVAWLRLHRTVKVPRLVAAGALVAATPLAARLVPLAAMTLLAVILVALGVVETVRYASARPERGPERALPSRGRGRYPADFVRPLGLG